MDETERKESSRLKNKKASTLLYKEVKKRGVIKTAAGEYWEQWMKEWILEVDRVAVTIFAWCIGTFLLVISSPSGQNII